MQETPEKGPIIHLKKHILKYDKRHNSTTIALGEVAPSYINAYTCA